MALRKYASEVFKAFSNCGFVKIHARGVRATVTAVKSGIRVKS
jgi:hypothetical protein